jgi:hypothetical protein
MALEKIENEGEYVKIEIKTFLAKLQELIKDKNE